MTRYCHLLALKKVQFPDLFIYKIYANNPLLYFIIIDWHFNIFLVQMLIIHSVMDQ